MKKINVTCVQKIHLISAVISAFYSSDLVYENILTIHPPENFSLTKTLILAFGDNKDSKIALFSDFRAQCIL